MTQLKSPYPYFGGKATIMPEVWLRLGRVDNFVDPFFGSGATLLTNPAPTPPLETVNDINAHLTNFWRAVQADPEAVAHHADWPVSELDLCARGDWLFYRPGAQEFIERMRADPDYYDAKSAGWWVWGLSCWIGSGWGRNEKRVQVKAQMPRLSGAQGVNRQLPHLGDRGKSVHRQRPHLGNAGQGVNRQRPHLGGVFGSGQKGVLGDTISSDLANYMRALSDRFRRVRICCGDWRRVLGYSVTTTHGLTAVVLDPPYSAEAGRDPNLYGEHDDLEISHAVRQWAIENGNNSLLRIALFGYREEHDAQMPDGWTRLDWITAGGYAMQGKGKGRTNRKKEAVWFSPHCQQVEQLAMFEELSRIERET